MKATSLDEIRQSTKFQPSIWGDYFLAYHSDNTEISIAEQEELERQKEMVRKLVAQNQEDLVHKLELFDAIQRLGVLYHFEKEIDEFLQNIHNNYVMHNSKDSDLRTIALRFRLLRQQGYNVPCDVFSKFIDNEGNFTKSIEDDVEGMQNLYEAAHLGQHGEEILDRAIEFCSSRLQMKSAVNSLSKHVTEALRMPIRKTLTRLGARKFISLYGEDVKHNEILLNFAKLDFNIVQKMHQRELSDVTRWWKAIDVVNIMPYARDRIVECYFWIVGVYFEPQYSKSRTKLTKITALASIIDDTYEYATLDELQLLTDAIQSWDVNNALEDSPPHIKMCYKTLLSTYAEIEEEMEKEGASYQVQYAKEEMKKLCGAYFEEAKWLYNSYIPTFEEYMKVSFVSSGYIMMSTSSLVGMGNHLVSKDDFDWITSEPLIVRASLVICRLMDDLVGDEYEQKPSSVHCYMKQYGVSEGEARDELRRQVKNAWKDMNEECLEPRSASMPILMRIFNLACVISLLYGDDDCYSDPNKCKDWVNLVLVEKVTI
ncbi:hypothetical protein C2S53_006000 [Perilla frutescens var. hirtella]|uniref:Uncharacterized protein n=1 Tax=Perilla frutescens var. hirtella TaxID=608512 RepID=A0AAD4J2P3_PERFH|nr:hypothetical protein C2S53_006000 [Perilla frutescens var. hirtella]